MALADICSRCADPAETDLVVQWAAGREARDGTVIMKEVFRCRPCERLRARHRFRKAKNSCGDDILKLMFSEAMVQLPPPLARALDNPDAIASPMAPLPQPPGPAPAPEVEAAPAVEMEVNGPDRQVLFGRVVESMHAGAIPDILKPPEDPRGAWVGLAGACHYLGLEDPVDAVALGEALDKLPKTCCPVQDRQLHFLSLFAVSLQ
ncbi:unnamed protein product [Prorocentrum cordatum]|uniref:Uncharacterized protein n=1 Tax=Prorocentrum cordatum TaxID=2364126 RepID=A0ABN9QCU6_9DINO|nr:unnamed protein product [Polarella glacialis]